MLYLAYGSNLHPDRLAGRIAGVRVAGRTELAGWELCWHKHGQDGSGKCNIVPRRGGRLCVALFHIDRQQLACLDRVEGRGAGYEHLHLEVSGFGSVITYSAADSHIDDALQPFEWYKELVTAGCEYHDFDAGYVARVRRISHCADPDRHRHNANMALAEQLRAGQGGRCRPGSGMT